MRAAVWVATTRHAVDMKIRRRGVCCVCVACVQCVHALRCVRVRVRCACGVRCVLRCVVRVALCVACAVCALCVSTLAWVAQVHVCGLINKAG